MKNLTLVDPLFFAGSKEECFRSLQTFGIPVHAIPVTEDGKIRNTERERWEKRRKLERMGKKPVGHVGVPSKNDVLFGYVASNTYCFASGDGN